MRNPNRIPIILKFIEQVWMKYSDLRLGQLLGNSLDETKDFYYLEDKDLIRSMENLYKEKCDKLENFVGPNGMKEFADELPRITKELMKESKKHGEAKTNEKI